MGFGLLGTLLILSLLIRPLVCQGPNTDEFFVSEFLQKLGLRLNPPKEFSGPYCSWKGVVCDDSGVNIVNLAFSGLGLSGTIPDNTIGKLIKLENLDLSRNRITGLPNDFWSLGSLKNLNLSHNQISGILPNNIGNFGQLQTLDLSHNILSGKIPETMSSLIGLKVLNLGQNLFESAIPLGILQCRSLVSIDLSGNKLNGSFPDGFGAAFPGLELLNLAGNQISSLDSDFVGMNSIRYFNVSGNLFEGSVTGVFGGPADVIDLSKNQLQGQVTFGSSKLIYLDVSENHFSGVVDADLSHYVNLKYLNLAYNGFTELQLLQIGMASGLEYLNLSGTNLMDPILSNVSNLSSLRVLDLSRNNLSGRIPPLFTKKLEVLDLSYNKLTGEVPLVLLKQLLVMEKFNFSYNDLSFCASEILNGTLQTGFFGLVNVCPIAANPVLLKKNAPKHRGLKLALALSLSMACLLAGLLFLAFGCRRRNKMWEVKQNSCMEEQTISGPFSFQADSTTWAADVKQATAVPVIVFEKPLLNFTFADLMSATSNFDRGMLLAEGRFGPVYSGVLPGGVHVAIKVLVHGSTMTDREAARELEYLGRVKHPNLVPLIGYCLAGDQRIAIYDYMENGNLQNLLYDLPLGIQATEDWKTDAWEDPGSEGSLTSWSFRYKIALGAARALAFLHHGCSPPIIHRDVKASSVYLDYNLEPKLSDFGLAKIFGNELEDEIARGSPGYTPPEYFEPGDSSPAAVTPKSDVYGYGIILFELITGKKPVEDDYTGARDSNLVRWVRELVRSNRRSAAIDPKIMGTGPETKMVEALKIGYLCTAEIPSKRPSMHQVVGLLKDLEPIMQH